jgi:hypothetical protein
MLSRVIYCYTECCYTECRDAEYRCAECHYTECRCAECHYAECRGAVGKASEGQTLFIFHLLVMQKKFL